MITNTSNPFNLTFGKEPPHMIARYGQSSEIISTFEAEEPSQQVYMITGVRGIGKTVFMTSISKIFKNNPDWIVVELNSSGELLKEFAAKMYNEKSLSNAFEADGINLSFWGIGVDLKKAKPITDLETAVERMLDRVVKDKKRILVTIDEVSNTKEMRYFAGAFQILIRHDYPIFLLMTGLYGNINKLQNEDNLTFLYRAPKIYLTSLNIYRISELYGQLLGVSKDDASTLAKMTKGYPFAFQVLGYFMYEKKCDLKKAVNESRLYLDEYVYDKIWTELSEKEKDILAYIAIKKNTEVRKIKEDLNIRPNEISVYRDRLIKKGILDGSRRGYIDFTLPFMSEYIQEHY
ncbi:MAG: ATP-binding protein [Lachnospiraceae bacterium]|nr:ATP-binding protein [Lachnospiraceae bacterium]